MRRTVFSNSLYQIRWQIVGWSALVLATALITMSVANALSGRGITDIVEQTPDAFKGLIGNTSDFNTMAGYIGQQIFGPNVVTIIVIMAITLYLAVSSKREERKLTQSLLTLPLSRTKLYFAQWSAVTLAILIACLALPLGIYFGLIIEDKSADWGRIWLSTLDCFLMVLAFGMVGYSIAMASGKHLIAITVAAGYAIVSFIVSMIAPVADWLQKADHFSIFHYYNSPQIMQNGLSVPDTLVLLAIILALILLGWYSFTRRDIKQ